MKGMQAVSFAVPYSFATFGFILNVGSFLRVSGSSRHILTDSDGQESCKGGSSCNFFHAQGDADIPQAITGRIDYLHEMLGLQNNEALCGKEHPVCKEYPNPGGSSEL